MFRIFMPIIFIILFSASSYADEAIVARVNGTALTMKELETEVDRLIPRITFHRDIPLEKRKFYYPKALDELINRELQYQDAVAKGIKPDKDKANAQLEQMKKKFKSKEEYEAALKKEGLTEEKLLGQIEKNMLIQSVTAKTVTEQAQISEAALKEYYEKNTSKFKQPESVKLRLFSTRDEKKANDVLVKLKSGDDFADIAYNMSEDDYRVKGGDIGYVHKGRMLPEIDEAAFKLKVGELSDVIKAGDMWYIIKVEDKKPEHQISFEETKDKLKKELEAEKTRGLREKWIADLRAKAKIETFLKTDTTEGKK